jgi:hypothetical protein
LAAIRPKLLIRRVALDELGGWDEGCITEDAELSLRLLRAGWSGLHVTVARSNLVGPARGTSAPATPTPTASSTTP